MPHIVNGEIVNDDAPHREPEKKRIRTWNDITASPSTNHGEGHTLRNRNTPNKNTQEKEVEVAPPVPPSIPQYLAHALNLENCNLEIPQANPLVRINAVYLVIFLFFTLIFGYKMAVCIMFMSYYVDCTNYCFIPN